MVYQFDPNPMNLKINASSINSLELSNDGVFLAVACQPISGSACVQVYNLADGSPVAQWMHGERSGLGVAFTDSGRGLYLLIRHDPGGYSLYRAELRGGEPHKVAEYGDIEDLHSLCRDPEGRFIAVLGNAFEVWDMAQGQVIRFREGAHQGRQVHAAFSSRPLDLYVYGTLEGFVVRYDLRRNEETGRWRAPEAFGSQVALSPDGQYLAAVAYGTYGIYVYNITNDQRVVPEFFNDKSSTDRLVFAPDSSMLTYLAVIATGIRIPTSEIVTGPNVTIGEHTAATSAWQAPVAAFATGNNIDIIRFIQE